MPGLRSIPVLIAGLLAASALLVRANVLPGDDFHANASAGAAALQTWYNDKGLWTSTDWWNAANCVEAIENVIVANNGSQYVDVLDRTFRLNSGKNFLNEFYDDEGWWALAWIRAFDLTGQRRYLNMAKTIFADMTTGWDSHCDGGIWWKKDRKYKNAIANELFLLVAVKLHQRTPGDAGPGSYLDWALREWSWFKNSGMINSENLINDGLDRFCNNNRRTTWTYNQGVILGGLTELYRITGDTNHLIQAQKIADATLQALVYPSGVLRELCEPDKCGGADVPQFKGIFARYLTDLYDATLKESYRDFLVVNARSIWASNRDSSNRFGFRWSGPIDSVDAARHSSALVPISALAEPATGNLLFAKGSGSRAFNHEVGGLHGVQSWRCDSNTTARPGFMQWGPYLASLPKGVHVVQFHLAVDAVRDSAAQLVRLDVREHAGGNVIAERDVRWSEFRSTDCPRIFEVTFTNSVPGSPLEFRVYWNHVPGAPALVISDVVLGRTPAWTAANMLHEVGHLDGWNSWTCDPLKDRRAGFMTKTGPQTEIPAGRHAAVFELKVDNFNRNDSKVATISVVDSGSGEAIATRTLTRSDFKTVLYHGFTLEFDAVAGRNYDFRTFWHYAPDAPRVSHRAVILRPVSLEGPQTTRSGM